jgi:cytidine deaminase
MKKVEISSKITVFDNLDELPDQEQILLARAKEATLKSYAPYSNFKVGCAVLMETGEIISGGNQENAAYPACICAERVVLATASSMYPGIKPVKMAIVVKNENKPQLEPAAPCGECRQTIFEIEKRYNQPLRILMKGEVGRVFMVDSVGELLPLAFSKKDLEQSE